MPDFRKSSLDEITPIPAKSSFLDSIFLSCNKYSLKFPTIYSQQNAGDSTECV